MKDIILKLTLFSLLWTTAQAESSNFTEKIASILQPHTKSLTNFVSNHKKKFLFTAIAPIFIGFVVGGVLARLTISTPIDSPYHVYDEVCPYFHYTSTYGNEAGLFDIETTILYCDGWQESPWIGHFQDLIDSIPYEYSIMNKNIQILSPIFEMQGAEGTVGNGCINTYKFNTAFGQDSDVLCALRLLKKHACNVKGKIILSCRSRGGAVGANLLGVLGTENHELLAKSGISNDERLDIVKRIAKINFAAPFLDMKETLNYHLGRPLSLLARYITLPIATHALFNPYSSLRRPLDMIQSWPKELIDNNVLVYVIYAKPDSIIGNKTDEKFINALRQMGISPEQEMCDDDHNGSQNFRSLRDESYSLLHDEITDKRETLKPDEIAFYQDKGQLF